MDDELEKRMHLAQVASSLVHSLRRKEKIKVRQPLTKIMIPILYPGERERLELVEELIVSETNVKTVEYLDDASGVLVKKIKPNFRKLGAMFGAKVKKLAPMISSLNQEQIQTFERDGQYSFEVDAENVTLSLEEVEIVSEDIPGWLVASEDGLTVALDVTISDELRREGLARDVVNRIQNLRKTKGLDVQDKIEIAYQSQEKLMMEAIKEHGDYIKRETQAMSLQEGVNGAPAETLDVDGIGLIIALKVVG